MEELLIESDDTRIDSASGTNQVTTLLTKPNMNFLENIKPEFIVAYCDNEKVFAAIVENDPEILHEYLRSAGFVYNKD